jgi:predicted dehydrogenase
MDSQDLGAGRRGRQGPVRLAVVGLGVIGRAMLDTAVAHPSYTVVRMADIDRAALDRAGAVHADIRTCAPAEAITADDVDVVYIATPPAVHAELAVVAMEAGKAVLCEKPLAVSVGDGTKMCEVAARTGVPAVVHFPFSTMAPVRRLEQLLNDGAAGRVLGVDIRLNFPVWPRTFQASAGWVGERAEGGFVREVFSHFGYLTDRLLGPLRPVTVGVDLPPDGSAEVAAYGLLKCGDIPVRVSGHAGVAAPEQYEWILWGTKRSYLLRDWVQLLTSDGGDWSAVETADNAPGEDLLSQLAQLVRGESRTDLATFAAGLRVQEVVEAFHAER